MPHVNGSTTLSNEEVLRYSRHLILPDVGVDGQRKLKAGRVLLIGAGGLGSPLALYLAAAGGGRSASSISMWSTCRICSAKCCTVRRMWVVRSSSRRAIAFATSILTYMSNYTRRVSRRRTRSTSFAI